MLVFACAPRPADTKPASPNQAPSVGPAKESLSDDAVCQTHGYDFAYAPYFEGDERRLQCGLGPGTPCIGEASRCDGATRLLSCYRGREGALDCDEHCSHTGEHGITYSTGRCEPKDTGSACVCCNMIKGVETCIESGPWQGA